jgi:hypothetical protein
VVAIEQWDAVHVAKGVESYAYYLKDVNGRNGQKNGCHPSAF